MAISYGFYDSVGGDRVYNAEQMSSIFDGIIEDGIFSTLGDSFLIVENTGMNVAVGTGRAWFNHTWTYNDAPVVLSIGIANPLLPRIDVVYLEINEDVGVRANSFNVLQGTPGSTPVAPTLTNTATVHQYPLAHVYVGASVTGITQANITNKIGLSETPFVTGPLEYIDASDLVAQWESEFMAWFDDMKDQLTTDAAGNLQIQIDTHDHSALTHGAQIPTDGIANGAVTSEKIAADGVETINLKDLSVTSLKLGNSSVTNAKIDTNAITPEKININVAGNGLSGGNGAALAVNVDSATIEIIGDILRVKDSGLTHAKLANRTRRIYVPYSSMHLFGSTVYGSYYNGVFGVMLNNTSANSTIFNMISPVDMVVGSSVVFKMHYYGGPAGAGNCRINYSTVLIPDSADETLGSGALTTSGMPIANRVVSATLFSMIFPANYILNISIARDYANAADTFTGDFFLVGFSAEYTADS